MRVIGRTNTPGGFSIKRLNGGIHSLSSNASTKGNGLTKDFYEKTEVRHPFQSLGKANAKNTLSSVKIKSSNPKKYISFNM